MILCDVLPDVCSGGHWGNDDCILFAPGPGHGLVRVSANGGEPEIVTIPDLTRNEHGHRYPEILPGGEAALFTIAEVGGFSTASIGILSLRTGEWRTLISGGTSPHYLPTGHLVYAQTGALLAAPFDLDRLDVTGPPVRVLEGVITMGGAEYSVSSDGSLAYVPGSGGWPARALAWVDRQGHFEPLPLPPRHYTLPRLSPDGRHIAVAIIDRQTGNPDIWVCELARNTLSRLTTSPDVDFTPVWTPDGKRVTFASAVRGPEPRLDLVWMPVEGTEQEDILRDMKGAQFANSWSPDGRTLLFTDEHPETKFDMWAVSLEEGSEPRPLIRTRFNETAAVFSPDGRWIAYQSDRSGRHEVYVRPWGEPGPDYPISTEGGTEPVWSRAGSELFYRNASRMMVVAVKTRPEFSVSTPELLFEGGYETYRLAANYDVSVDGQRFLMVWEQEAAPTEINIVLNWAEEVKELCPTGR
ncbi:MAG: PD40 domain-containing protein [Candidatus Eisenbacteria sp.]|nr:PD40 domain-containing protein [Candidatus Eisenbacteria bacterium]